jgi:hypothetical protein
MATSAQKLLDIVDILAKQYGFDKKEAMQFIANENLLPTKLVKMIESDGQASDLKWASPQAKKLGEEHGIVPNGDGTAKNGKWTCKDVKDAMTKTVTVKKINATWQAVKFAEENEMSLDGKVGTGKDNKITIADIKGWIEEDSSSDDEPEE